MDIKKFSTKLRSRASIIKKRKNKYNKNLAIK